MNQLITMLSLLAQRHPDLWKRLDAERALLPPAQNYWPSYCFVPQTFAYGILGKGKPMTTLEMWEMVDGPRFAALAGWRVTQGIYRFDPDLFDELWDTPLNCSGLRSSEARIEIIGHFWRKLIETISGGWCTLIETERKLIETGTL